METVNFSHTQSSQHVSLGSALSPWKWLRRLRERRELLSLLSQPDYLLKDIGLQRDEITREGLKRFWKE
jgi:uncharacterized protein YjiS (DUF1127 family)